jgi:hypothetical protein
MSYKIGDDEGTPRWVKVFGALAALAVVLLVILLVFGGDHGPGRHGSSPSAGMTSGYLPR